MQYISLKNKANCLPVSEEQLAWYSQCISYSLLEALSPQGSSELGWEQAFELDESSVMVKQLFLWLSLLKSASLHHTADVLPLYHTEVTSYSRKMMNRRKLPQEERKSSN